MKEDSISEIIINAFSKLREMGKFEELYRLSQSAKKEAYKAEEAHRDEIKRLRFGEEDNGGDC